MNQRIYDQENQCASTMPFGYREQTLLEKLNERKECLELELKKINEGIKLLNSDQGKKFFEIMKNIGMIRIN